MVDKGHHLGNGMVSRHIRDQVVHLVRHLAVRRVTLGRGAELQDVHGLAGIHVHQVPDPVGQRHRIRGLFREGTPERLVQVP